MIGEIDRYHGVVLRQLVVTHVGRLSIGVANVAGRVDAFCIDAGAFQIKHSSKRLPPWRFTYLAENVAELEELGRTYSPVWVVLVCGIDGVVCLTLDELRSILELGGGEVGWIRVSRSRNAMYRVGGRRGDLPNAKARGVQPILSSLKSVTASGSKG